MENAFREVVLARGCGEVAFPPPERSRITINEDRKFLLGHAAAATEEGDLASGFGPAVERHIAEKADYIRQRFDAGTADSALPKLERSEVHAEAGSGS